MTDKLKQTIGEELAKLPKENQDAINTLDWAKIVEEVGGKYLLDESQINDFQVETLLVLTGITNPEFYAVNIENQVGVIKKDADDMADEITEKVFIPINNLVVGNIVKGERIKKSTGEQNLNFIISGGDYSSFIEKRNDIIDSNPTKEVVSDIM